jgi:hypothetical protein
MYLQAIEALEAAGADWHILDFEKQLWRHHSRSYANHCDMLCDTLNSRGGFTQGAKTVHATAVTGT